MIHIALGVLLFYISMLALAAWVFVPENQNFAQKLKALRDIAFMLAFIMACIGAGITGVFIILTSIK